MPGELADERSFKRALREVAGEVGREEIEAAAEDAVRLANDALMAAAENPPSGATLDEWHMRPIADSVETSFETAQSEGELAKGDRIVIEWTHPHADKIEMGVKPHTIEGDPLLVFEWENIPDEVAEQFRPAWESDDNFLEEPMVAFAEVDHPGIPAVGFIRKGFTEAIQKHFV